MPYLRKTNHKQNGNVILTCLALMIIMTLWSLSATRNASTTLQSNYNARMKQISFEAAEFAVRQVEQKILNEITLAEHVAQLFDGTDGLYSMAIDTDPFIEMAMPPKGFDYRNSEDWLATSFDTDSFFKDLSYIEVEYDNDEDSFTYLDRQPRAIVEFLGRTEKNVGSQKSGRWAFRISAIAWGPHGLASSVVRTHIAINL